MQFSAGNFLVSASIPPAYNLALQHIGAAPVRELRVRRNGESRTPPAEIRVSLSWPAVEWRLPIPELRDPRQYEFDLPLAMLDSRKLEMVARPEEATIRIVLGRDGDERPVTILGPWEWPAFSDARTCLAAYVLSEDPLIRAVVGHATRCLPNHVVGPETAAFLLRHAYESLQASHLIRYAEPLTIRKSPDLTYQLIRRPNQMLLPKGDLPGEGNCLDLSLALAGVLEGLQMAPCILLLGDAPNQFSHALGGVWSHPKSFEPPQTRDSAAIRRDISENRLIPVEATGICQGRHILDFDQARRRAIEFVQQAPIVETVNIRSCRPPLGNVLPLQLSVEPVVRRAEDLAEALGRELKRPMIETLHLLYGTLAAGGDLTRKLEEAIPWNASETIEAIRDTIRRRTADPKEGRTNGFEHCLALARDRAKGRGSTIVREEDLWWALLKVRNSSVERILARSGPGIPVLESVLGRISPGVGDETNPSSSYHFESQLSRNRSEGGI